MKTVVITVLHAMVARNLLYGELLGRLAASGVRVVLLVPAYKRLYFEDVFKGTGAIIEPVDLDRIVDLPRNVLFHRFSFLLIRSHYLWYKRVERRDRHGGARSWFKYLFEELFVALFAGRRPARRLFRHLFARYADSSAFEDILARYRPDLVFASDQFDPADYLCVRAARKAGIKTLTMVRSWDNCYSKGVLPVLPDQLLTNTHILKEEASTLHDVPLERIEVIGLPQFDGFFFCAPTPREEFMKRIGADPAKKLVVYAPAGTILSDIDGQICEILVAAMSSGGIRHPVHLLVRNHPNHPADLSRFEDKSGITVEYPGVRFGEMPKETELSRADQTHLRDTLAHADVLVWVATTLGIDAAVFDRPEIVINFDGYSKRPYTRSVRRFHNEDHMKKLIATGGVRVVEHPEGLVEWINRYLDDPSLDAEGRRKIIETQLVFTDGKSGERLGQAIVSALD